MATSEGIRSVPPESNGSPTAARRARPAAEITTTDELLSFASHELRAPLATILTTAKLFESIPVEGWPDLIATITTEGLRMSAVVDNLLTHARLNSGHGLYPEPVLLGRAIDSTVAAFARDHPGPDIRVTAKPGLVVEVDPEDLELVVGNYLSNARKYGGGQPIVVEARANRRSAVVSVLDRGPGIADEDCARVFEPFYRTAEYAKVQPGIGIGLFLCRRLIEGYGGRVWARGRPGGGAIFGFSLPLVRVDLD